MMPRRVGTTSWWRDYTPELNLPSAYRKIPLGRMWIGYQAYDSIALAKALDVLWLNQDYIPVIHEFLWHLVVITGLPLAKDSAAKTEKVSKLLLRIEN